MIPSSRSSCGRPTSNKLQNFRKFDKKKILSALDESEENPFGILLSI